MNNLIRDIQSDYFELVDRFFGGPYAEMRKHGVSPYEIANDLANRKRAREAFAAEQHEFAALVREFWESRREPLNRAVKNLGGLKSYFGGDIFPSYHSNLPGSVGLYSDTLVIPDPLMKIVDIVGKTTQPAYTFFYLIKHALTVLTYRDFALAEVDPPIVVIVPNQSLTDAAFLQTLQVASNENALDHAAAIFGERFTSIDELTRSVSNMSTVKDILLKIKNPARLLFDLDWSGSTEEKITRYVNQTLGEIGVPDPSSLPVGPAVVRSIVGRMMQANDVVLGGSTLGGTPLIEAPTSWEFLQWKYEYDGKASALSESMLTHAVATSGSESLGLMANIPPDALIKLRKEGALADLRNTLSEGLKAIDAAQRADVAKVSDEIANNLKAAFTQHQKEIMDLEARNKKFYGLDISTFVSSAAITIGAVLTGNVPLQLLAAVTGLAGATDAKELIRTYRELAAHSDRLKRSPTGILWKYKRDKWKPYNL